MFRGTFTALVTPFRNGDVDFAAFEKLVEAQIAAGITGLVAVGTTGESPTLTHEEKEKVIQRAVKIANGRCKLICSDGTISRSRPATRASFGSTRLNFRLQPLSRPLRRDCRNFACTALQAATRHSRWQPPLGPVRLPNASTVQLCPCGRMAL